MNVLSLFDGMGCLGIALKDMGVEFNYYKSEIDKHAIKQSKLNFPESTQLGDVTKWKEWKINWASINLIGAGSPCQGFSFAGKQLAFDDPRSALFFTFVEILEHCRKHNPNVMFLLENVKMKKEHELVISRYMGVAPIEINSALLSAQNRVRLYWTNIANQPYGLFGDMACTIPQPKDKGILLKDILESEVDEKYYLSDKMIKYFSNRAANFNQGKVNVREEEGKASCLTSSMASCDISDNFIKVDTNLKASANQEKANCFTAGGNSGGLHSDMTLIVASRGRNPENPKSREIGLNTEQMLEPRYDGKTNCLTSVQKDNLVMQINPSTESGGKQTYQQNRVYDSNGISPALCANKADLIIKENNNYIQYADGYEQDNRAYFNDGKSGTLDIKPNRQKGLLTNSRIRRLTPTECARLQTIPTWYKWECSDTQQYRMLGNGWTVDVIKHILSYL
jgi:site-specific DNA-cytosine methylase